jgi:hypothetical protein
MTDNELQYVLTLEQQLLEIGYHGSQVADIIKYSIGRLDIKTLETLDETETVVVIDALQWYIKLYTKCCASIK